MVKELQDNLYQGRHVATPPNGDPDIVKLVQAYGIKAVLHKIMKMKKLAKENAES